MDFVQVFIGFFVFCFWYTSDHDFRFTEGKTNGKRQSLTKERKTNLDQEHAKNDEARISPTPNKDKKKQAKDVVHDDNASWDSMMQW